MRRDHQRDPDRGPAEKIRIEIEADLALDRRVLNGIDQALFEFLAEQSAPGIQSSNTP
jgi:hypothetical protein